MAPIAGKVEAVPDPAAVAALVSVTVVPEIAVTYAPSGMFALTHLCPICRPVAEDTVT